MWHVHVCARINGETRSRMAKKRLAGKHLGTKGCQRDCKVFGGCSHDFQWEVLLMFFITGGKRRTSWPPKTRRPLKGRTAGHKPYPGCAFSGYRGRKELVRGKSDSSAWRQASRAELERVSSCGAQVVPTRHQGRLLARSVSSTGCQTHSAGWDL